MRQLLIRLGLALLAVGACTAAIAENLNLVASSDGKVSAVLQTTDRAADPAHAGTFKGTGSIVFTLAGVALPAIGPMPYSGLVVTGTSVTGGSLATSKDEQLQNVLGTGLNLVLAKGSALTVAGSPVTLSFSGSASVVAPFKDSNGNAIKASLTKFTVSTSGAVAAQATIALTQPIQLPCVSVNSGTFTLNLDVPPGKAPDVKWSCPSASVSINLPGVVSNDDKSIDLQATGVSFDADGLLSFDATFNGPTPLTVSLAEPSNFTLKLSYANVKMDHSSIVGAEFKGSLTLPPAFTTTDKGAGGSDPVTINSVDVKVTNDKVTISAGTSGFTACWNNFKLTVPAGSAGSPNFILDLSDKDAVPGEISPEGGNLPASWEGVYIKEATLSFPESFGKDASLNVKNLLIESGGVSGKFTANLGDLAKFSPPNFSGQLNSLSLTLLKGQVTDFDAKGTIRIGSDGANDGGVGVEIGCSQSGLFTITLDQSTPINLASLGLQLQVDQGTFTYDKSTNVASLKITGSISVPKNATGDLAVLRGAAFAVKDLSIDSTGKLSISGAYLDLPHPVSVDVGPVSLGLSQIGIEQDDNGNPAVLLTGDVAIKELPVSGQIGFKGLLISSSGVSFGDISLKASMADVFSVSAELSHDKFGGSTILANGNRVDKNYPEWAGKSEDVYSGTADVELDCFGPSGGFGGGLKFLVSHTGWFVMGTADISSGIQLGSTPFSLFGFTGGIGHNVVPDTPGATGVPGIDYQLIPYAPGKAGDEWTLVAGVRLGTSDGYTAWGDLILSLMFGNNLAIDLDGKFFLLTDQVSILDPEYPPQDRYVHANIHYDQASSTFSTFVNANLYFPDKKTYNNGIGVYATGSMDLLISPTDKHFHVGGPITPPNVSTGAMPVIQNPITVSVMGIQGPSAALDVDMDTNAGKFSFQTATILGFSWSASVDLGPFSAGVNVSDQQWFYAGLSFQEHPMHAQGTLALGINASAGFYASLWPFGTANVSAGVNGILEGQVTDDNGGFNVQVQGELDAHISILCFSGSVGVHFSIGGG